MGNTHSGKPRKSLEKPGFPGIHGKFSSLICTYSKLTFWYILIRVKIFMDIHSKIDHVGVTQQV
jgi:hypothetical protein